MIRYPLSVILLPSAFCLLPCASLAQRPLPPRAPVTLLETDFDLSQGVIRLDVDLGAPRAAKLVLDTGNASSALDLDAARTLKVPLDDSRKTRMGSGEDAPEYLLARPAHARLGSEPLPGLVFAAAPLSKTLYDRYAIACDGTLGYAAFKNRVLQLDYPARKLRLLDSAPATTATSVPIPIKWRSAGTGTPPLVTVDRLRVGTRTIPAQVDTFFIGPVILFTAKLASLDTTPDKGGRGVIYAQAKLPPARLRESVGLGAAVLPAGETVYLAGPEAHVPQAEIAAVLGNAFFHGSVLTLDFPHGQLLVTPGHGGTQSDFPLRPTTTGVEPVLTPPPQFSPAARPGVR